MERTISLKHQIAVFNLLEQMRRLHPKQPHWYLGVEPAHQQKGYGSALVKHILNRLC